jgi:hypothetical protein
MALTFPSVIVLSVSITESFTSAFGASSMKVIATCTIFVMACLSCPCFFERRSNCSLSRPQSPDCLHIVIMLTSSFDVDARSEA